MRGRLRSRSTTAGRGGGSPPAKLPRPEEVVERVGAVPLDDDVYHDTAPLERRERQLLVARAILDEQDERAHADPPPVRPGSVK